MDDRGKPRLNWIMENRQNEFAEPDALLKHLSARDGFKFRSIDHKDKPDFRITMPDGKTIGLEVTLAVEGEYIRAQKLQDTLYPREATIITNLRDRTPRRSNQELIHGMFDPEQPWKGIDTEMIERWERIADKLKIKRTKFPGFQKFDENWLLIRDPLPNAYGAIERRFACQHAAKMFSQPFKNEADFDAVFIISGQYIFRWTHGHLNFSRVFRHALAFQPA